MRRLFFRRVLAILFSVSLPVLSCSWDYAIWIPRSKSADPFYRFIKDGKAGYINREGKVVIPPTLRYLGANGGGEFHDGLLKIGFSGEYLNEKGEKAFRRTLYRGWDFSEGLAAAMLPDNNQWGFINTAGEFVITPRFATHPDGYVWSFSERLAMVEVRGAIGYIAKTGEWAIPPRFLDGDFFSDGMARVVVEGPCAYTREDHPCPDFGALPRGQKAVESLPACRYTFIDKAGKIVSEHRFDYALSFSEGLAPVRVGEMWGYIDKSGATVIAARFQRAWPFSEGLARVKLNGKYGFIDRAGKFVIQPILDGAEDFSEGLSVVGDEESGFWYIDSTGRIALPGRFAVASSFFKGLAHVQLDENSFAYIDRAGRRVFSYSHD